MLYYFFEEKEKGNNTVLVSFPLPLDGNKYIYMIISNILSKGCRRYKTKEVLKAKCEELDNVQIFNEWKIEGNRIFLNFYLNFKKDKSKEYKKEVLELFLLYINENLVVDGGFKEEYFKDAKKQVLNDIDINKKDSVNWGKEKITGILNHGFLYGEIEENRLYKMSTITNRELLRVWFDIKNDTSPLIQVCGEEDLKQLTKDILKKFMRISRLTKVNKKNMDMEYRETKESYDGENSVLIACLKSDFNLNNEYEKLLIPYNILFGRENARVKEVMREEGINANINEEIDSLSGIITLKFIGDLEEIDKVLEILKEEVNIINTGNFDEKEILGSINKTLSFIDNIDNDEIKYINFLVKAKCEDRNFNMASLISRIKECTFSDVKEGVKELKLISTMKIIEKHQKKG